MSQRIAGMMVVVFSVLPCGAEDVRFGKTKLALSSEPKEVAVDLTISDDRLSVRSVTPSAFFDVPFAAITHIAYTENSHHRLGTGAKVAMFSPGIGAATMLSKRRDYWILIEWTNGATPSAATLLLDKSEAFTFKTALEMKTGRKIDELQEKNNPFDPTLGSTDVDKVLPFQESLVSAALKRAMASVGCVVGPARSPSALQCRRKRGNSELTGFGGEEVTAQLEDQGPQTHVRLMTARVGSQSRNWSGLILKSAEQSLNANPVSP